jgi:hypothetical protein
VCKAEFPRRREALEHVALGHFHNVWDDTSGGSLFAVPSGGPFVCQHCPFKSIVRQQFIGHIVSQHEALKHVLAIQFNGERTIEDLIEPVGAGESFPGSDEGGVANEDELEGEDDAVEDDEEDLDDEVEDEEMEDEDIAGLVSTEMSEQADDGEHMESW